MSFGEGLVVFDSSLRSLTPISSKAITALLERIARSARDTDTRPARDGPLPSFRQLFMLGQTAEDYSVDTFQSVLRKEISIELTSREVRYARADVWACGARTV